MIYTLKSCGKRHAFCGICRPDLCGKHPSAETRAKLSAAQRRRKHSAETRAKMSISQRKRPPRSAETCARISAAKRGRNSHWKPCRRHFRSSVGRWFVRINGYSYRLSRIILGMKLGRELTPQEIAHHIDGDPSNDHPDNLRFFPSHGAHTAHHHALDAPYEAGR